MKYKNRKTSFFIILVFFFSIVALNTKIGMGALDNIEEGDSIYYKVSRYNVPLDLILPPGGSIDSSKVTLDLSDSIVGLKIMKKNQDGTFILNSFLILSKAITIPFPDSTSSDVKSIFGDDFTIPAGVGISLGYDIPGSNLMTLFDSDSSNDKPGFPVYIEPSSTADFKTYIEDLLVDNPSVNVTVDDGTDVFKITLDAGSSPANMTVVAEWYKTGANAGLFKELDISGQILNSNNNNVYSVAIAFSFDKKENQPLPDEIKNMEMQTFKIDKASFDLSFTGIFSDNIEQDAIDKLDQLKANLTSREGEDIARLSITEVDGLFYKTNLDIRDFDTNSWVPIFKDLWFNGFTGTPVYNYAGSNSFNPYISTIYSTPSFIPIFAPGITSDWTIWEANMKTIDTITNIVTTAISSASAKNTLLDYGLTLDRFSAKNEMRQSGAFKYFYSESNISLSYKASDSDISNRPPTFNGSETASLAINANSWMSYTDKGLFAGIGSKISAKLTVGNMPLNVTTRGDGTINFDLDLKIQNSKFDSLPDAKDASPAGGDGGILPGVNGFEILPLLAAFVTTGLYVKRKKLKS